MYDTIATIIALKVGYKQTKERAAQIGVRDMIVGYVAHLKRAGYSAMPTSVCSVNVVKGEFFPSFLFKMLIEHFVVLQCLPDYFFPGWCGTAASLPPGTLHITVRYDHSLQSGQLLP